MIHLKSIWRLLKIAAELLPYYAPLPWPDLLDALMKSSETPFSNMVHGVHLLSLLREHFILSYLLNWVWLFCQKSNQL